MGLLAELRYHFYFFQQAHFIPKPKFSTDQIPDLTGRVALITGGSVGLGKQTAKVLLEHNAKVYIAARDKTRANQAIAELKEATGKEAIFVDLDLASIESVRQAANEFLSREHELHILYNNAGIMWCPKDWLTKDGFDMQWGTNVVGHFLLTELLVPALVEGAKSSPDGYARIVTTSSSGAFLKGLDYDTFKDTPKRKKRTTHDLYCQSKLANAMIAREAARRYAGKKILSFSCNPGNIKTELWRHAPSILMFFANRFVLKPVEMGPLTQLWAGTMPDAVQFNGEFLIPWARVGKCRDEVYDLKETEKLWKWLEENTTS